MAADRVLLLGESGTGKSSAIRGLDPQSTFIINCLSKRLPFPGWKRSYQEITKENTSGNLFNSVNGTEVAKMMLHVNNNMPHIKVLVIEDFGYINSYKLFDRAKETGYNKFTDTALEMKTIVTLPEKFRDDLIVIFSMHPDVSENIDGNRTVRPKVGGKMIENQLTLEGLFEKVLYTRVILDEKTKAIRYVFETKKSNDLSSPAKTPVGLFEDNYIENDLQLVVEAIRLFDNS